MVKTLNELKHISDGHLLEVYEIAKEHEDNFNDHFCVDYSFKEIESELEERGYHLQWVR